MEIRTIFSLLVLVTSVFGQRGSGDAIPMLNYGVVFTQEGSFQSDLQSWMHGFHIPIGFSPAHTQYEPESTEVRRALQALKGSLLRNWEAVQHDLELSLPSPSRLDLDAGTLDLPGVDAADMAKKFPSLLRLSPEHRRYIEKMLGAPSKLTNATEDGDWIEKCREATEENLCPVIELDAFLKEYLETTLFHTGPLSDALLFSARTLQALDSRMKLRALASGLDALAAGRLTPQVLGPEVLEAALEQVASQLQARGWKQRLAHASPSYYYGTEDTFALWDGHTLSVMVRLPLTSDSGLLDLYRVDTFPVAIHQGRDDATVLQDVPEFLAVKRDRSGYMELSASQLARCRTAAGLLDNCADVQATTLSSSPSCLLAILTDAKDTVRATCNYQTLEHGLLPSVREVSPGQVLVSNVTDYVVQCQESTHSKAACTQCLVTVPCRCSLLAQGFETTMKLRECDSALSSQEALLPLHPVNLGYLSKLPPESTGSWTGLNGSSLVTDVTAYLPLPPVNFTTSSDLDYFYGISSHDLEYLSRIIGEGHSNNDSSSRETPRPPVEELLLVLCIFVFVFSMCLLVFQRRYLDSRLQKIELAHIDCYHLDDKCPPPNLEVVPPRQS